MDLSKLSDDTLLALHSGKPLDYSKLPDSDLLALSEGAKPAKAQMGTAEYIGRGVTSALPLAAMAGGGLLGTALGPMGSVGGAGLGYAAGEETKGLLNHYLFGDETPSTSPLDQAKRVGNSFKEGAETEMGGQSLIKGTGLLAQGARSLNDAADGALGKYAKKAVKYGLVHYAGVPWPLAPAAVEGMEGLLGRLGKAAPDAVEAGAPAAEKVVADTATQAAGAAPKRNIMIKPILDELAAIRKSLPQTGGQDIDALMQEVKVLNKYGKVNLQELDAIKSRLGEVLDSEETGPNLRRAAVLAQDAAERVATPAKKYGPAPTSPFAKTIFPVKKK